MPPDVLSQFHPAVAGWFRSRFPAPTEAQARAWAAITGALVSGWATLDAVLRVHWNT